MIKSNGLATTEAVHNEGKKKALVIAVSDYNDKQIPALEFCKNDGEAMYSTLDQLGYEINQKHIGTITGQEFKDTIFDFFRDEGLTTKDTLLFYFSGHGLLDDRGGQFFGTTDISPKFPDRNGIKFDYLVDQMEKSNSFKKIAILDCCYSGAAHPNVKGKAGGDSDDEAEKLGRDALKVFEQSKGICVLASSLSNKKSYFIEDKKMSTFTYYIIEGLKGNKDSVDKDGCVTPASLEEYAFSQMQKYDKNSQHPVNNLSTSGKIILAYYEKLIKKLSVTLDQEVFEKMLEQAAERGALKAEKAREEAAQKAAQYEKAREEAAQKAAQAEIARQAALEAERAREVSAKKAALEAEKTREEAAQKAAQAEIARQAALEAERAREVSAKKAALETENARQDALKAQYAKELYRGGVSPLTNLSAGMKSVLKPESKISSWWEQFPIGRWYVRNTDVDYKKTYDYFTLVLRSGYIFLRTYKGKQDSGGWSYDGKRLLLESYNRKFKLDVKFKRVNYNNSEAYFEGKHGWSWFSFAYQGSE